jgi:hypothetical protein
MTKLNAKQRAKIEAMSKMYCQMERPEDIPSEKLNRNEGRHKVEEKEYRLQAFKNKQARVYGTEGSIRAKRTFFASCAAVKKTNKADPNELERAASRLVDVVSTVADASI